MLQLILNKSNLYMLSSLQINTGPFDKAGNKVSV